jgi:hypothetical protein
MALVSDSQKSNSLFSPSKNSLSLRKSSTQDFQDILKSLNIIDPESLSKEDLSNIIRRIDDYNGLFTTQQLKNIKYEDFSEHVFFDSAVNKVAYAFDRIANIPYDKDELENIKFNNKTEGYTNHVLKNLYPSSLGYINFSGSERVVVYDQKGRILNDISKEKRKVGTLSPDNQKFSFEFWLKIDAPEVLGNQVLFKKVKNENNILDGFICYIEESDDVSDSYFKINMLIIINNKYSLSTCLVEKNSWQNIVISINEEKGFKKTNFLINGIIIEENKVARSGSGVKHTSFSENIKSLNVPFVLGGVFIPNDQNSSAESVFTWNNVAFTGLVGKIDEFRYFAKIRSSNTIKKYMHRNIFAQRGLKLYLRMNEPGGEYTNSCLVIDYSGNKLHGILYSKDQQNNFSVITNTSSVKENINTPLKNEIKIDSPVLNAGYTSIQAIRKKLTDVAKEYDKNNPNLIFNLMPKHYFLNASDFQNLPVFSNDSEYTYPVSVVGEDGFSTNTKNTSLNSTIPANNELVNIVLIWARFFDQLKLYISSIGNFLNVDYDSINKESVIGMQIPILCKMYGINFKEILPSATKEKLNNFNLSHEDIISNIGIRKIQNILWQRFLINTQDFLKSKGTIKSVESTFNSFGIEYSKFIDIKEYATFNDIKLDNNFFVLEKKANLLNFGNSKEIAVSPTYTDVSVNDFSNNKTFLNIENIRTHSTSKSGVGEDIFLGLNIDWSIEMFFMFKDTIKSKNITNESGYGLKQCLFRLDEGNEKNLALIVYYENYDNVKKDLGKLTVNIQPIKNNASYNVTIEILDVNIYDLPKYFCISQKIDYNNNSITYDLFLDDIGKHDSLKKSQKLSKTISDITLRDANNNITKTLQQIINDDLNHSFHKNILDMSIGNYNYISNNMLTHLISSGADTNFEGQIIKVRGWKKKLSNKECKSHSENIDNIGTESNIMHDNVIFDFEFSETVSTKQTQNNISTYIAKNNSRIFSNADFSSLINTCSIKTRNTSQINQFNIESFFIKKQNINIDSPIRSNRVNIVSYSEEENKELKNNFNFFPSNNIPIDFNYDEVSRVSIDMSITKSINSDISNILSDLNGFTYKMTNYFGKYDYSYKEIESLRDQYFEKFSDSILLNYSSIGNIFKYFDNIMSSILYDIVPSSVRFEGFNYVYESHILERHKYQYKNLNSCIAINDLSNSASFSRETGKFRRSIVYNNNRKLT